MPPPMQSEQMPVMTSSQPSRSKKGMTAAQLYSLHTIGSDATPHSSSGEVAHEAAKPAETMKEEKPMKPASTSDRINLNRIPHP